HDHRLRLDLPARDPGNLDGRGTGRHVLDPEQHVGHRHPHGTDVGRPANGHRRLQPEEVIAMLRRHDRSRGQALVELALALPVLLLIFMGLFDFGRAVFAYNSLSNAAREGARVAIVDQTVTGGVPIGATEASNQATGLGLNPADVTQVQVSYLMPDLSGPCATRSLG